MTPMMAQYREIKMKHPDAMLFFRLGDFYEMFFEDAVEASQLLQITLTARNKGDHKAPMCGVPHHAVNNYIAKLTRLGKKVAICEQLSDPTLPGIVKRDVIRIVTPGTTLDENILEQKQNNYLLALTLNNAIFSLAYADISTGEFLTTQVENEQNLQTEIERINPAEIIFPKNLEEKSFIKNLQKKMAAFIFAVDFDGNENINATEFLSAYLSSTQKSSLQHLQAAQPYEIADFMPLDEATLKNLELLSTLRENKKEGSLLWVLDNTITAMGGRMLRYFLIHPLTDKEKIQLRLDAVEALYKDQNLLDDLLQIFKNILDLERLVGRLSLSQGNARDLVGLANSLLQVPLIKNFLLRELPEINSIDEAGDAHLARRDERAYREYVSEEQRSQAGWIRPSGMEFISGSSLRADIGLLSKIKENIDALPELVELISRAIVDEPPLAITEGGMIKDGYNQELDELRKISREGKSYIQNLQQREIDRTGIHTLKIRFNNVFGYYIEVSRAQSKNVPADYIRKQTLVNAERFITPELKEFEEKVLGAEEKITALEQKLFQEIRGLVIREVKRIQKTAKYIALLDVLSGLAVTALKNNYCKPLIYDSAGINIKAGRHPVVEKMSFDGRFIANDTNLNNDADRLILITGPNMGGKSTYLRQVALITLMAQIGSFVPAQQAEIGIVDRIFTRVGASDNLVRGQSTFMVEMQETANILNNATEKSLVILDEVGRGTSTYDGMSIAWAITEFLHDKIRAKTLFATHYHELISLAEKLSNAANFSVAVKDDPDEGIIFLYKILPGGVDRSYGIEVAKLAGLPAEIIAKAKQILIDLEEGVLEQGIQKELSLTNQNVAN